MEEMSRLDRSQLFGSKLTYYLGKGHCCSFLCFSLGR